jgi:TonB family protein
MAALAISFRAPVLAWANVPEDDRRFKRILNGVLIVVTIICLLLLLMPKPKVDRAAPAELPPRLAKLMIEQRTPPPPPKPVIKPDAAKELEAKPGTPEPVKPEPLKKAAPVPEARVPQPNKPAGEIEGARRKAAGVGLLAMKDTLAELHSAPTAVQLAQNIKQGPGVGAGVGVGVGAGTDQGTPDRAMITSNAAGGSGGINTAGYSRNTGGGGLAGRATTLVEGVAGGGGGGGAGGGGRGGTGAGSGQGGGGGAGGTLQKSGSGKASRSIEDIRLVFERNKGSIYAIYNRALREDPTLQGKIVLKLTIAPSGEVTDARIESSELKSPDLERKLLARIKQFDFGAKSVEPMVATYPVDFLPS